MSYHANDNPKPHRNKSFSRSSLWTGLAIVMALVAVGAVAWTFWSVDTDLATAASASSLTQPEPKPALTIPAPSPDAPAIKPARP